MPPQRFSWSGASLQHRPTSIDGLCAVFLALTQYRYRYTSMAIFSSASWLPLYHLASIHGFNLPAIAHRNGRLAQLATGLLHYSASRASTVLLMATALLYNTHRHLSITGFACMVFLALTQLRYRYTIAARPSSAQTFHLSRYMISTT